MKWYQQRKFARVLILLGFTAFIYLLLYVFYFRYIPSSSGSYIDFQK